MGAFGQLSGSFLDDRLTASLGVRADGNTYTTGGLNFLGPSRPGWPCRTR
jgi:hypothetical protein